MTAAPPTADSGGVRVWTMPVEGLGEADVEPWESLLDGAERDRAARFVFPSGKIEFVAAHALARFALAHTGGYPAAAWRFATGDQGKPAALIDGARTDIHFNLSHAGGLVAVATAPFPLGLDVEPLGRVVEPRLATRWFRPEEVDWLDALPTSRAGEGFLRLWTLKEAFIKATGRGLSQGLATFWFQVCPPAIRFTPAIDDDPAAWHFEQRVLDGRFLAAISFRRPPGPLPNPVWRTVDPRSPPWASDAA